MNLTLSKKSRVDKEKKERDVKGFFSKLSRGLMLPISLLPIAGLFLGIGAAIVNGTDAGTFWNYLGLFMQNAGDVVFGNLPLLFAISIGITFTNDSGAAGLAAFVGWIVFNGAQRALIDTGLRADYTIFLSESEIQYLATQLGTTEFAFQFQDINGLVEANGLNWTVSANSGSSIITYDVNWEDLNAFFATVELANGNNLLAEIDTAATNGTSLSQVIAYDLATNSQFALVGQMFASAGAANGFTQQGTYFTSEGDAAYRIVLLGNSVLFTTSQFTQNQGILSLNTGVFGGLLVGGVVAISYNKWNEKQLPAVVGFWSGVRFVLTSVFVIALPLSLVTLLVWPWIGLGLYYLGIGLNTVPYGIDSLVFGIIERSLIPFGLHHVFYTPLWYTQAGGTIDANQTLAQIANTAGVDVSVVIGSIVGDSANTANIGASTTLAEAIALTTNTVVSSGDMIAQGDQNMWFWANTYIGADAANGYADWLTFDWLQTYLNVDPAQYQQGKYAFMIFGLAGAGLAMVKAAPKGKDREVAQSVIIAATFTAMLTGITEPIEFTFLFLAPWLFWGFHAIMAGFSFMFMDIFGANVGQTFSGGIIDLIIYGAVPYSAGVATDFYWAIVIGAVYFPIYYFVFYWAITKFDIKTPGRGQNTKLFTKTDFNAQKASKGAEADDERTEAVVAALGGYDNLNNVDACITRLRVKLNDPKKLNGDEIRALGASGIVGEGTKSIQAIFGGESDVLKQKINKKIKMLSEQDDKVKKAEPEKKPS